MNITLVCTNMLLIWNVIAIPGLYIVSADEPKQYMLHLEQSTWNHGQTVCRETGGTLATIYDYSTVPDVFIHNEHHFSNHGLFWIGLNRNNSNQSFVWDNGDPITWFNWKLDVLDNRSALCVGASSSKPYSWETLDCGRRLPFICQHTGGECRFLEFANMSIASHNYMYLYRKNEEHCKNVCVEELGTRCRSFDYYPVEKRCEFNSGDRWTLDQYYRYKQGWVYFHRTCISGEVIHVSASPSLDLGCMETTNVYVTHDVYSSHVVTVTRDVPVTRDVIVTSTHVDKTTVTLTETSTHVIVASPTFIFPSASVAEDPIEELKEIGEVAVERKKTLKKISVEDRRPSAKYVGYVAIIFLSFVFGSIVLFDITTLCQYQKRCGNVKANDSDPSKENRKSLKMFDWTNKTGRKDTGNEEIQTNVRLHNVRRLHELSTTGNVEEDPTTSYNSDQNKNKYQISKMIWRPFTFNTVDSGIDGSDTSSSPGYIDDCSDVFHFQYFPNETDKSETTSEPQLNHEKEETDVRYQITKF